MTTDTTQARNDAAGFADNFWENADRNGIKTLLERMRGAKQTCERLRHAYEARAMLEEEYGKTMLHIAQKQKASDTETGSTKTCLNIMQSEFISIAESHLQLANLLRENVAAPLNALINKQKAIRKELQSSIQKLYNSRHLQVQLVRKAHKRHNMEIEKANLLVQQQATDSDKLAVYKSAEVTIDKLKKVYDEALHDLEKIVEQWNCEWRKTCEGFESLEQERLAFMKSNFVTCANLMAGCVENAVQSYELINLEAAKIDPVQDLVDFVTEMRSTNVPPRALDYVKMYAYQETVFDKREIKNANKQHHNNTEKRMQNVTEDPLAAHPRDSSSDYMNGVSIYNNENARSPTDNTGHVMNEHMVVGVMEVYSEDDDGDDNDGDEATEYTSESETENEDRAPATTEPTIMDSKRHDPGKVNDCNALRGECKQQRGIIDKNSMTANLETKRTVEPAGFMNELAKDSQAREIEITDNPETHAEKQTEADIETQHLYNDVSKITSRSTKVVDPTTKLNRLSTIAIDTSQYSKSAQFSPVRTPISEQEDSKNQDSNGSDYDNSDAAAFELDDMLRRLDSKRLSREEHNNGSQQIQGPKPSSTSSSPILQKSQRRMSSSQPLQTLHGPQKLQSKYSSRRMSAVDNRRPSSKDNNYLGFTGRSDDANFDIYDPFESLSSKETGTFSTRQISLNGRNSSFSDNDFTMKTKTQPSAQLIRDRMLQQDDPLKKRNSHQSTFSSSSSATDSVGSQREANRKKRYNRDEFINDFYSIGTKSTGKPDNSLSSKPAGYDEHFIDFAYALYDYDAADEGEISFKEGDLLGILSKSDEGEQGWWEASLLNDKSRKVVCTGIVPSNFLETAMK